MNRTPSTTKHRHRGAKLPHAVSTDRDSSKTVQDTVCPKLKRITIHVNKMNSSSIRHANETKPTIQMT